MATATRRRSRTFSTFRLPDFSGGLNVRDALTELALNEMSDCMNVTINERGGVEKRMGADKWNAAAAANLITYGGYSSVADKLLWYSQADGKLYSDPGTGVLTLRRTWTAGSPIGIADFAGSVYANHPVDGLYSSADGVTWNLVVAGSGTVPKGSLLAVWQNKLWVADPSSNLLSFSAPGDATLWAAVDDGGSNYIREGNDFPIVCLFGASGSDFQTKPSLIVGKRSGGVGSVHRVTDAATADYITLDQQVGPAGQLAMDALYGKVYVLSTAGLFATDGQSALVPVGGKLEPLFRPTVLDYALASGYCLKADGRKLLLSVARIVGTENDVAYEYHPLFTDAEGNGSFTVRDDPAACYVRYPKAGDVTLAASPATTGQIYKLNQGGDDDGSDIVSWFSSKVFGPMGGVRGRVQQAKVQLGGTVDLMVLPDFAAASTQYTLSSAGGSGFVWGTGTWGPTGTGVWGSGDPPESVVEIWPRRAGENFQLRFDETSSGTRTRNVPLESGVETIGAFAVYGVDLTISPVSIV